MNERAGFAFALTLCFLGAQRDSALAAESKGDAATLGIEWITIPGGSFTMGSDEEPNPAAVYQDGPTHRVTLKAFQGEDARHQQAVPGLRRCRHMPACAQPRTRVRPSSRFFIGRRRRTTAG